jgi:hypothetical protein
MLVHFLTIFLVNFIFKGTEVDWKAACTCIEVEASFFRQPITCDHVKFLNAHESEIDALHILEVTFADFYGNSCNSFY